MLDFHFRICNQILIELSDGNLWHNYFSSNLQALEYCLNHVACINTKEWKALWCLKKLSLVPIEKWIKQVGMEIITVIRRFESGCFKSFQPLSFALMTHEPSACNLWSIYLKPNFSCCGNAGITVFLYILDLWNQNTFYCYCIATHSISKVRTDANVMLINISCHINMLCCRCQNRTMVNESVYIQAFVCGLVKVCQDVTH